MTTQAVPFAGLDAGQLAVQQATLRVQAELAEELGRSPAFIGHVEAPNINKAISLDTLFGIAEVLDVQPYKFLLFDE
mgnify:CR=1 FL=1